MENGTILKAVSVVLAFAVLVICIFSAAHLIGFRDGAKWGNRPASAVLKNNVVISGDIGTSSFELFIMSYIVIALCLCLYAGVRLFARQAAAQCIGLIPLAVILYKYWSLFQWKNDYLEVNSEFGYYYWIINTIPFDWICVVSIAALLAAQFVIVFMSYRSSFSQNRFGPTA
jgi:hypothetical protein